MAKTPPNQRDNDITAKPDYAGQSEAAGSVTLAAGEKFKFTAQDGTVHTFTNHAAVEQDIHPETILATGILPPGIVLAQNTTVQADSKADPATEDVQPDPEARLEDEHEGHDTAPIIAQSDARGEVTSGFDTTAVRHEITSLKTRRLAENKIPEPEITVSDVKVTEGGEASFTIKLSEPTTRDIKVKFTTADGTAVSGGDSNIGEDDYTPNMGYATIPAGATSATVKVTTLDDNVYEGDEMFTLTLTEIVEGPGQIVDGEAIATIMENDAYPTISISDVTVVENDPSGLAIFTVSLSHPAAKDITVDFATADGLAIAGSDYESNAGMVTIPAGSTTATIAVNIIDHPTYENTEDFTLTLSNATGPASISDNQAVGTILDNEAMPEISIDDVTVTEGGTATFTVTLSGTADQDISVDFTTGDGLAIAGSDYTANSGTITIPAGSTSATIDVVTINDGVFENMEDFQVNLSNPTGPATINDAQGVGTILEASPQPTISIDDVTVTEGGAATFTVTLSGAADQDITVDFTTGDGLAIAGSDYTANSGTITIPAGSTSATIDVVTINDGVFENTEDFQVNLSNPTGPATINDAQGVGTIFEASPQPTISIDDVTVTEGNTATFTVLLSGPADQDITVDFTTGDGLAIADSDYTTNSGTITIPAGSTSATIDVVTFDDMVFENTENFSVTLSNATGPATISNTQGVGTILDNDAEFVVGGVTEVLPDTINVVYTIDMSGSMGADSGLNNLSLFEVAKLAIDNLNSIYSNFAAKGINVVTTVVGFAESTIVSQTYDLTSAADRSGFQNYLQNLNFDFTNMGKETNYEIALNQIQDWFTNTAPQNMAKNVVYFLSDGIPTVGNTQAGIDQFVPFRDVTGIEVSSVGIGNGADPQYLDPFDNSYNWDGSVGSEIVLDPSNLAITLARSLLNSPPEPTIDHITSVANDSVVFGDNVLIPQANIQDPLEYIEDEIIDPIEVALDNDTVPSNQPLLDAINAVGNADVIVTQDGDDWIFSQGGDDLVFANGGDDVVLSGDGNDWVYAGSGSDVVIAGSGTDMVYAGSGDDKIFSGSGNDIILGGMGDDTVILEGGENIIKYNSANDGDDVIRNFDNISTGGHDAVDLSAVFDELETTMGTLTPQQREAMVQLQQINATTVILTLAGVAGFSITFENSADNSIGAFQIGQGSSVDIIVENNTPGLTLTGTNDPLQGDILYGGIGDDSIDGRGGSDVLVGGAGDDDIIGGGGDDILIGDEGNDQLQGGSGADLLIGDAGADVLHGGSGDDELHGGGGDDQLFGEAGDDILVGGEGDDVMTGGAGSDTYIFRDSDINLNGVDTDIITDFTVGSITSGGDILDLSELLQGVSTTPDGTELDSYLDFSFDGSNTMVAIDTDQGGSVDHQIALQNIDLLATYGNNDINIIDALLTNQNLEVV